MLTVEAVSKELPGVCQLLLSLLPAMVCAHGLEDLQNADDRYEVSGVCHGSQMGRQGHHLFRMANIWKQSGLAASPKDHPRAVFLIVPLMHSFCTLLEANAAFIISRPCFVMAATHTKEGELSS